MGINSTIPLAIAAAFLTEVNRLCNLVLAVLLAKCSNSGSLPYTLPFTQALTRAWLYVTIIDINTVVVVIPYAVCVGTYLSIHR